MQRARIGKIILKNENKNGNMRTYRGFINIQ